MNARRLYRCRHDRQLAGVAAGIAEYLGMDPTVVRILWILSVFFGGFTILVYILLAFVMPLEPAMGPMPAPAPGSMPGSAAAGPVAAGDPSAATGETGSTGQTTVAGWAAPAASGGWVAPETTWAPGAAWNAGTAWAPAHEHAGGTRRPGRLGLYVGVLLVVFGSIALAQVLFPAIVGRGVLGAGLLIALGAALLVGALRPGPAESTGLTESTSASEPTQP